VDRLFASLVNEGFGRRLVRARRLKELSQAELALKVGLSRTAIANLESGNQGVLLHHVFALGRALNVDVRELLPPADELGPVSIHSSAEAFVELSKAQLGVMLGVDDEKS
jgi:transcriptional regulator with XRE-family HTH domain